MATSGPDRRVTAVIEGALHSLAPDPGAALRGSGFVRPLAQTARQMGVEILPPSRTRQ
jgi:hypothetical protein